MTTDKDLVALATLAVAKYFLTVGRTAESYLYLLDETCRCAGKFLGEDEATRLALDAASMQMSRQISSQALKYVKEGKGGSNGEVVQ